MISFVPIRCPFCNKLLSFQCYGDKEPQYDLTCSSDFCAEISFDDNWDFFSLYFCPNSNPYIKAYVEKRRGSKIFPVPILTIIREKHPPVSQELPNFDINDFNIDQNIKMLVIFS